MKAPKKPLTEDGQVVRYNLAYINHRIRGRDNGVEERRWIGKTSCLQRSG